MEKAFKSTKFTFVAPFNKQREILSGHRDFTTPANTRDKAGRDCKLAITAPDILIIKYHPVVKQSNSRTGVIHSPWPPWPHVRPRPNSLCSLQPRFPNCLNSSLGREINLVDKYFTLSPATGQGRVTPPQSGPGCYQSFSQVLRSRVRWNKTSSGLAFPSLPLRVSLLTRAADTGGRCRQAGRLDGW